MDKEKRYFFVSYSHTDKYQVQLVIERLQRANIDVWSDDKLEPGTVWFAAIQQAVERAYGLLIFISERLTDFVMAELRLAFTGKQRIVPILLEHGIKLPPDLAMIQYVDLSGDRFEAGIEKLIATLHRWLAEDPAVASQMQPILKSDDIKQLATEIVEQTAAESQPESAAHPFHFIVHGHDLTFHDEVVDYKSLGDANRSQPNQDKYRDCCFTSFDNCWANEFAVVLISPDDLVHRQQIQPKKNRARWARKM
jgi:hypothetical protein